MINTYNKKVVHVDFDQFLDTLLFFLSKISFFFSFIQTKHFESMKTSLKKLRGLATLRHERKERRLRQPSDELAMAAQVFC